MIELLLNIKDAVAGKEKLAPHEISSFETEYARIVAAGFSANPPPVKEKGKKTICSGTIDRLSKS